MKTRHSAEQIVAKLRQGDVELGNRTVLDEFLRPAFRQRFYTSVKALQKDLDKWLAFHNQERPHQGYRNMGKRPIDTVQGFVKLSPKKPS